MRKYTHGVGACVSSELIKNLFISSNDKSLRVIINSYTMVALQFYDAYKSHLLTIYVAEERFKAVKQTTSSALHLTSQSAESSKNPSSSTISNKKKCYFNKQPPGKDIVQQQAPEI